jgi:hypothetical protein
MRLERRKGCYAGEVAVETKSFSVHLPSLHPILAQPNTVAVPLLRNARDMR